MKKTLRETFISIICRCKIKNLSYRKNLINGPSPREPQGGHTKSRCYQNLAKTNYRIKIGLLEKKSGPITFYNRSTGL